MIRGSTLLIIREIRIALRYHLIYVRMKTVKKKKKKITGVGENMKKLKPLCTVGVTVKWYCYYGKQYGGSLIH